MQHLERLAAQEAARAAQELTWLHAVAESVEALITSWDFDIRQVAVAQVDAVDAIS